VLCLLVPAARYRRLANHWNNLLDSLAYDAPLLLGRLAGAAACLERPLAIAGTPYGHLHRVARHAPPDLFRLGDQACVVPSLAGDGMAIALHSAMAATSTWLAGGNAAEYHARLARRARAPLRFASVIHAACRAPKLQPMVAAACRVCPAMLGLAASLTRVARPASTPVRVASLPRLMHKAALAKGPRQACAQPTRSTCAMPRPPSQSR
jgi:hypothetical protein